jgi:hypothetical protein
MQEIKQKNWLIVAFISLILFGVFFYIVINNNNKIFLNTPIYFFLIIIIDFAATAFLSGAMKSVSRYEVKTQNKSIYIAGPAVIFFIILYIGYKYRPQVDQSPLTLSVLFTDDINNQLIKEGTVSVRVGLFHDVKDINNDGSVLFTGIISDYKGSDIDLTIDVPGYHSVKRNQYKLSESADFTNLSISLVKDEDTLFTQGRLVALPSRTGIGNALINFEGVNKTFKTDSGGNFSATLPFKSGTEVRVIVLKDNKEIYNSIRTISNNGFLSISPN